MTTKRLGNRKRKAPSWRRPVAASLPWTAVYGAICFALALALSAPALAQSEEVPADLQVALFEKIFRYVKTVDKKEIVVLTVFDQDGRRKARQISAAFTDLGVESRPVALEELRTTILDEGSVLYLLPSVSSPDVATLCEEFRLLSLSGFPAAVETGSAAVGVRLKDGRPQIMVNMKKLEHDGHRISADLLKLAEVIR